MRITLQTIESFFIHHKKIFLGLLLLILIIVSSGFFLQNLGNNYITLWEDSMHANVIKNIANNCCTPVLHLQEITDTYKNWQNNHVWLHKPLLPFYIAASSYHFLGESLLAMRLPNLIFAELMALLLVLISFRFFNKTTGFLAALFFLSNNFLFTLVQSVQFSGFTDILTAFFALVAFYFILSILKTSEKKSYVGLGIAVGLAILCKGGLGLIPFVTLVVLIISTKRFREIKNLIFAILPIALIMVPTSLILYTLFPKQFIFENRYQLSHLYKDLENWGRPWDFYISIFTTQLIGALLTGFAYLSTFISFKSKNLNARAAGVFILTYIIPLSFGVTKIPNFIFPIVPILCLLIAYMFTEWWKEKRYEFLISAALSIPLYFMLMQYKLVDQTGLLFFRFNFVIIELGIFILLVILLRKIHISKYSVLAILGISMIFYLAVPIHINILTVQKEEIDAEFQQTIRTESSTLKNVLPEKSILVVTPNRILFNSYLYYQFWSGFDAVQLTKNTSIEQLVGRIKQKSSSPVYFLSTTTVPTYTLITKTPTGFLYKVN